MGSGIIEDDKKATPFITLENVGYIYPSEFTVNGWPAIKGVNLSVHKGDFILFQGRNGSGKTTLLKLIGGLMLPTEGNVIYHGEKVSPVYLNQNAAEFIAPALTIREQLCVGIGGNMPAMSCVAPDSQEKRFFKLLEPYDLDLERKLDRFTSELSGGQRQIIALMCAVLSKANLLLLDEYASFMDEKTAFISDRLINDLNKKNNITILAVDHRRRYLEKGAYEFHLNSSRKEE